MSRVINLTEHRTPKRRERDDSPPSEVEGYHASEVQRERGRGSRGEELSERERDAFSQFGLSTFAEEYANLRKRTLAEDFSASASAYALLRAQMATVIRALNVMDKSFKDSGGRNAYSYVAMHGLARELSHDLRAFGDQHETAERVRREVVQPMLQAVATDVVSKLGKTRVGIHKRLKPNAAAMTSAALTSLQEQLAQVFAEAEARAGELIAGVLAGRG